MAPDTPEAPPNLAGRLRRVGEILIGLSRSPIPTHFFQMLADEAPAVMPHDYLAVCLEDREKEGYLVHALTPAARASPSPPACSPRTRGCRAG